MLLEPGKPWSGKSRRQPPLQEPSPNVVDQLIISGYGYLKMLSMFTNAIKSTSSLVRKRHLIDQWKFNGNSEFENLEKKPLARRKCAETAAHALVWRSLSHQSAKRRKAERRVRLCCVSSSAVSSARVRSPGESGTSRALDWRSRRARRFAHPPLLSLKRTKHHSSVPKRF